MFRSTISRGWPPSRIAAFSAGQAERVPAHRPQHGPAVAAAEVREDVAHRVVEDVPHVQRPRRVRQHLELVPVVRRLLAGRAGRACRRRCSSSQTRCHFASICWGRICPWVQKSLSCERPWGVSAAGRVRLLVYASSCSTCSILAHVLELFPDTAEIRDGVLRVGGCSTIELAEEYGTPLVVYCEETIRAAARAWRAGAADGTVVYGTKAFPNVPIMKILWEEGIGADVSTLGEMQYARGRGDSAVRVGRARQQQVGRGARASRRRHDAWLVVMDEPGEVERCVEPGVKRVLLRITPGHRGRTPREDHDRAPGLEVRRLAGGGAVDVIRRARGRQGSRCSVSTSTSARSLTDVSARLVVGWSGSSELRSELAGSRRSSTSAAASDIRYTLDEPEPPSTRGVRATRGGSAAVGGGSRARGSSSSPAGRSSAGPE